MGLEIEELWSDGIIYMDAFLGRFITTKLFMPHLRKNLLNQSRW